MASNNTTTGPCHILDLPTEGKRKFFDSFDYVFSDIDGVVWNVEANIPGVAKGFELLKQAGKPITYITNNSVRQLQSALKRFAGLNIEVEENDIMHPAKSIVEYLQHMKFEGLIYIIASPYFKAVLKEAGFRLKDGPNEQIEDSYMALAGEIFAPEPEPIKAVIIDVDFNLSAVKLVKAQLYLRDPNCLFIAGATDMFLPVRPNIGILGPGPFVKTIAEATNRHPKTLGKPGKELAHVLMLRYKIQDPKRVLMIGDMLEQDVGFGRQCGFQTLVVLSGGTSLAGLHAETNTQYIPDYYADSVADFVELLEDIKKVNL